MGALLFHFLKLRFSWPIVFVVGACPLSLLVTLLGFAGLVYKGVFLALCLGTISVCIKLRAYRSIDSLHISEKWFWLGYIPFTLLYLPYAMAPESSPDGMAYHLGLVARYYREHALVPVPENMYASLSQGVDMLFLFAFAFGRHSSAALVHFTYLIALPLMIADYATRKGWAIAGAFAGLMVYATPVIGIDGISAYIDVALAAIWFALFVITDEFEVRRVIPAGILAGFTYATKYTAFVAVFFMIWQWRKHWRALAGACAVASLFILPWVIRNWIWLENPFAPFFNAWFPNPHINVAFERGYSAYLRTYGLTSVSQWAANIFVRGKELNGVLGPVWILSPLGFWQWQWLFAAATYPLNIGTRFLIPALPFLALGMGRFFGRWRWLAIGVCATHLILSWPTNVRRYSDIFAWRLDRPSWKAALRRQQEDTYLGTRDPVYRIARMIEDRVPPGEKVFSFFTLADSYTSREILTYYYSAHSQAINNVLLTPIAEENWPSLRQEIRLTQPQKKIRIAQNATDGSQTWSIAEIEPRPARLRASHMPYTLNLAMDGNPLTVWETGLSMKPMWIEAEFDNDVSALTVWMARKLTSAKLQVENGTVSGSYFVPQIPDMRRWATETLRGMGILYFIVDESNYGYQDFVDRAAEWNIDAVDKRETGTLFRIK